MSVRRLLCILLSLFLILSLAGCRSDTENSSSDIFSENSDASARGYVNMLCCYADSFNPYTASSEINRNLSRLIFDPILKLDNNYEVVYCLAESVALDGTVCTVKLKNTTFTDGTPLTASDVVYSYNLARGSSTIYASNLYEVSSVTAADTLTVVFNLTRHDPFFVKLLDFPILKTDSDKRTDIDDVVLPPIGGGRYYPSEDGTRLIRNDNYHGKIGEIPEIRLVNSPDADSVSHYVEVGATDFYYTDIADGQIVRMSGQKTDINLNQLVYIGINHTYGQLGQRNMRYAISSALDREEICSLAYYNNATPANGFYPPYFKETAPVQTLKSSADMQITVENLEKIGYNSLNGQGYRVNSSGNSPSYTLLVNSENRSRVATANRIASQLETAGIKIKVIEKSLADYTAALQSGDFQLYLGEIRILANMDMSGLVMTGGSAAYGIVKPQPLEDGTVPADNIADSISALYSGNATVPDTAGVLITEMPVIPVCYRNGLLFSNNNIKLSSGEKISASRSDIFLSAEDYVYKK